LLRASPYMLPVTARLGLLLVLIAGSGSAQPQAGSAAPPAAPGLPNAPAPPPPPPEMPAPEAPPAKAPGGAPAEPSPAPDPSAKAGAQAPAAPASSGPAPAGTEEAAPPAAAAPGWTPSWYATPGTPAGAPGAASPPVTADAGRHPGSKPRDFLSRLEIGGLLGAGLDATDSPTRLGGFYLEGGHRIARDFVLSAHYGFASGHVVARLPGNRSGQFGAPNDVDVLQTSHVVDVSFGYVAELRAGPVRLWGMPFIGPRLSFLVNDVAPRSAFEGEMGARAGVWASDTLEASAFVAYAPALAKNHDVPDVYGALLSDFRFGATARARLGEPLGLSVGYEGDVVTLQHQRQTSHALVLGICWFLE